MKLLEIIIALVICILIVAVYIVYLQCSIGEYKETENGIILQIKKIPKPPRAMSDSYKYLNFWVKYYSIKYNLT